MKFVVDGPAQMSEVAKRLLEIVARRESATVIGLSGDLGAGKTAFVQALAKELGVLAAVQSPTFVIEKRYALPAGVAFKNLVHVDAYRIDDASELEPLRFRETLSDPGNLVVIEWPERITAALPKGTRVIAFRHVDEKTREVVIPDA